jgi:hypothetical protein
MCVYLFPCNSSWYTVSQSAMSFFFRIYLNFFPTAALAQGIKITVK